MSRTVSFSGLFDIEDALSSAGAAEKPTKGNDKTMANCPINEQTADGTVVGRCWHHLPDGCTCPRHGNVSPEVKVFEEERRLTLENDVLARRGEALLG